MYFVFFLFGICWSHDKKIVDLQKLNCEFFVTAKKYECKQYVNSFALKVIMLEKSKKISYSERV